MKELKFFLASSGELKNERDKIQIFFLKEVDRLIKQGIYPKLIVWEDLKHTFRQDRIQDYFNQEMLDCDVVIVLFGKKLGEFTVEEFLLAWDQIRNNALKPKELFVFFKNITISSKDQQAFKSYQDIIDLKNTIEEKQQLYCEYDNTDHLGYRHKAGQLAMSMFYIIFRDIKRIIN